MTVDDLISPEYRQEQMRLHADPRGYGGRGRKWSTQVKALAWSYDCQSILDYGCGEGSLGVYLRLVDLETGKPLGRQFVIREYDPAIPGLDDLPEHPFDCVVCTDVLEHVEEDRIERVLDHLCGLTQKVLFVVISLVETAKTLSDGRQAHILLREPAWWKSRFAARGFQIVQELEVKPEKQWVAVLKP